ncbi:MAG TPA: isoamylase early set domain-containing protein [Verrucomicrobiae bacterium]|nr:isoamylase early set domain-containing protein [Verrucomicrobiae bacterium]
MNSTIASKSKAFATNINVQFIFSSPQNLTIKKIMKFKPDEPRTPSTKETDEIVPRLPPEPNMHSAARHANDKDKKPPIPFNTLPPHLKNMEFFLEAPMARSVKLAADFTDWDRFSLDMIQAIDGVWWTIVPLLPGKYTYRFIVDGHWCDDPRNPLRVPNPFGTSNAVVDVT